MPVGGSVSLRRQATCGDGGPAAIAARMLAASPAGMPAVLALPRGITMATAWPAGGLAQGRFAGGPAHERGLVLWRAVPGLPVAAGIAGGQRCLATWAGLCRAAGEAHLIVSGSAVTPPDEGSRTTAPGRAVFWILAGRYRLCLTTSC